MNNKMLVCNRLTFTKEYTKEVERYEDMGIELPEHFESNKYNKFKFCCDDYMIQAFTQFEEDKRYCIIWMDEETFIIDKDFEEILALKKGEELEKDGKSKES